MMSSQFAHWPPSPDQPTSFVTDLDESNKVPGQPDILIRKASVDDASNLVSSSTGSYSSLHQHRDSISTSATDSTGSSPTTTASLLDSHSIGETPSNSPDTPASAQSLGYIALGPAIHSAPTQDFHHVNLADSNRPPPPVKKARNLKNLAVNTQGTIGAGRSLLTAALPLHNSSDEMAAHLVPPTPGFVKPITPRRKSSGLGLTITTNSMTLPLRRNPDTVPPTPSLIRPASLRHFPSSPSLNLMTSKGAPEGGMRLPPISSRNAVTVGFADIPSELDEEEEQNYDVPQSREEKPESYPDGPICIYDPHVYLYYEPTVQQALTYDVIFNVASEVRNPLTVVAKDLSAAEAGSQPSILDPQTSPVTPKASNTDIDTATTTLPEYVHIPWEHNTDIVPDLYRLVKIVDERVQQGKKVLIHCQCGVSRSASLIVAYGLYKNPSITVQEAYDAVKRRSKWIGPNMSLIMQLQEFRSGLLRTSAGVTKTVSMASLTRPSFNRSQSAQGEHFVRSHSRMPMSAPLPAEVVHAGSEPISTSSRDDHVPSGPSSAPSGMRWPSEPDSPLTVSKSQETLPSASDVPSEKQPTRIDPPRLQMQLPPASPDSVESPQSTDFAMTSSLPAVSLDDSLGLTSPRSTTFGAALESCHPHLFSTIRNDSFGQESQPQTSLNLAATQLPQQPRALPSYVNVAVKTAKPVLPSLETSMTAAADSQARAELGARIGMTRRSNYDLRAAFLSGTSKEADQLPDLPPLPSNQGRKVPKLKAAPSLPDFAEALMSPRATEFTNNPFREPSMNTNRQSGNQVVERMSGQNTLRSGEPDPRSPPQKGANPIVRNILDVL